MRGSPDEHVPVSSPNTSSPVWPPGSWLFIFSLLWILQLSPSPSAAFLSSSHLDWHCRTQSHRDTIKEWSRHGESEIREEGDTNPGANKLPSQRPHRIHVIVEYAFVDNIPYACECLAPTPRCNDRNKDRERERVAFFSFPSLTPWC